MPPGSVPTGAPTSTSTGPHVELCSRKTALALLCLTQFMVILDVSIVNVALLALPDRPRQPLSPDPQPVELAV